MLIIAGLAVIKKFLSKKRALKRHDNVLKLRVCPCNGNDTRTKISMTSCLAIRIASRNFFFKNDLTIFDVFLFAHFVFHV